ncbi:hypothetical protein pb186bvf_010435 [Paramecium bursaria]
MIRKIVFQFTQSKSLPTIIKQCKSEEQVYKIFLQHEDKFLPEHYLLALKQLKINKSRFDPPQDLRQNFKDQLIPLLGLVPEKDKWSFYSQMSNHGGFKNELKDLSNKINARSVKQVAILLWGLSKNDITRPSLVVSIVQQLQTNIDKLELFQDQKKVIEKPKQQENEEEHQISEDEEIVDAKTNKQLELFKYKFKDLVLILWSLKIYHDINYKELIVHAFQTAIKYQDNPDIVTNNNLILLLQSTEKFKVDEQIKYYIVQIVEHLMTQQLQQENVLTLINYIVTLAQLKSHIDIRLVQNSIMLVIKQMIKKQKKDNSVFSTKFIAILLWNMNKVGIYDNEIYLQLIDNIRKQSYFKPMDLSQIIFVLMKQLIRQPQFGEYSKILVWLIKMRGQEIQLKNLLWKIRVNGLI